jgi:hypothetical protein
MLSAKCYLLLLTPGLATVSLLESESAFEIVTKVAADIKKKRHQQKTAIF